jgi:hypothetical protein
VAFGHVARQRDGIAADRSRDIAGEEIAAMRPFEVVAFRLEMKRMVRPARRVLDLEIPLPGQVRDRWLGGVDRFRRVSGGEHLIHALGFSNSRRAAELPDDSGDGDFVVSASRGQHGIHIGGILNVRSTRWRAEASLALLFAVVMLVVGGGAVWVMSRKPVHENAAAVPSTAAAAPSDRYAAPVEESRRLARALVAGDNLPGLSDDDDDVVLRPLSVS